MAQVHFITESEKEILLIDLTNLTDYAIVPELVTTASGMAQSSAGPGSLRTLLDLTGTRVNKVVIESLKSLSQNNGRYAKATAFVGVSKTWSIILTVMFRMRGKKNHKVLASRADAVQWLARW